MLVVRPIQLADIDAFTALCATAGLGLSSLPKQPEPLRHKIEHSVRCFANPEPLSDDLYIFVMEETESGTLYGTSQLSAKTLGWTDGYCFHVEQIPLLNHPHPPHSVSILNPIKVVKPATELRGLYLHPNHRKGGLSKLLSFSRFLFLGAHPAQFQSTIIAEMRGFIEENKTCPFWNGIGRNFLDLDFEKVSQQLEVNPYLVREILPTHPIYISLLPKPVQEVIGITHRNTEIALLELMAEGMKPSGEIDLIDGGPILEAEIADLRSIKEQVVTTLTKIDDQVPQESTAIISNSRINFRSCTGVVVSQGNGVALHPDVVRTLQLDIGDTVRFITRHRPTTAHKGHP